MSAITSSIKYAIDMSSTSNTSRVLRSRRHQNFQLSGRKLLFLCIFLFRLLNAFSIRTFFQPDEYYQALEPAHRYVFGYGYKTWEWSYGLRSSLHVWIYILSYRVGLLLHLPDEWVIEFCPRVTSALIATISELYLVKFAKCFAELRGMAPNQLAISAMVLSLSNPFNWFFITRSFSNSFELLLTVVAWSYWPWQRRKFTYTSFYISCAFGLTSCIVRPTNSLIWLYLGTKFLWDRRVSFQLAKLMIGLIIELLVILGATTLLDFYFYGHWTVPMYNFIEFNVVRNFSMFYGLAPWHFHIGQSVPVLLTTQLPFFIWSLVFNRFPILNGLVVSNILAFSLISHKEFRFLFPLQPLFMLIAAPVALKFWRWRLKLKRALLIVFTVLLVTISLFFTLRHERGVLDVVNYLRNEPSVTNFGILAPCHSTPWQSHLHNPQFNDSWFVTCEPPINIEGANSDILKTYKDESDIFYDDPAAYIKNLQTDLSHVVAFAPLHEVLTLLGFTEQKRYFNSDFHWDSRRWGDIIVYAMPT